MSATYDGTPIVGLIKDGTDPWVEVDGVPADWTTSPLPRVPCPCDEGFHVILPGVLDGMNTPEGIQRCDACDTYPGDLDAALALARHVGGIVKFHNEERS